MSSSFVVKSAKSDVSIDDATVLDYLRAKPDFFRQHPALLAELDLPHQSGGAVSLVERQVAILRERNINSRHKLGELIEIARENDKLFEQTRDLVLQLITAETTDEMFTTLSQALRSNFAIDISQTLLLSNGSVIEQLQIDPQYARSLETAQREVPNLLDLRQAYCGTLRDHEKQFLFATDAGKVGSAAICSRTIQPDTRLVFAVSHPEQSHYSSDTGTLFVEYLADVLQGMLKSRLGQAG